MAARSPSEAGFFLGLLKPYRAAIVLALTLLTIDSLVTLSLPWFAGRVVQSILGGVVPDALLLAWLGVIGVQALVSFGNAVVLGSTSSHVVADIGSRVYDHLQSLPLSWHQERKRGEILSLATSDVWRLGAFLTSTLVPLLPLGLTCFGALVMLLNIEPWIGLAVAVAVPAFIVTLRLFARQLRPLADASSHEDAVKYGMAEQNLSSLAMIKSFTREADESARYLSQGHTVRELEIRQLKIASALTPAFRWLAAAAVIALLWIGGRGIATGLITPPELVTLLLYGLLLTQPVSQLAGVYGQVQVARGAASRIMRLLAESPEPDSGDLEPGAARGEIRFDAVAFSYPGRDSLFMNLNLHVAAGETVAITGRNGAGKSTIAHLLMRFVDPADGSISLDGSDLRQLSLRHLREQIGVVSQNVLMFNASIAHNIGYGRYPATRAQIESAARAANAHEFIEGLPHGYDTIVGDEGIRLSGGQKQRVALARALLKDPAILVLDEATAMFDPEGEQGFISECREILRLRTVLLITHRPASLALADRVLRLENGELHELESQAHSVAAR